MSGLNSLSFRVSFSLCSNRSSLSVYDGQLYGLVISFDLYVGLEIELKSLRQVLYPLSRLTGPLYGFFTQSYYVTLAGLELMIVLYPKWVVH